ncbi:MAG: hypothetical protein ACO2Z9_10655 [Crocinitomicaceae bacterium]
MKYFSIIFLVLFMISCQKDNNELPQDEPYSPPPPYGTGGCLFSGDHAFFIGQVIDSFSGSPINNYKIQYHQGVGLSKDSVTDGTYLLQASEGYFYDGCSFTISIPDTIFIDLTDENGTYHSLWFLSDTLVLGDTITMDFQL